MAQTPKTKRQEAGQHGEDRALAKLLQHGLQLITRNYRCRFGEIDLILRDDQQIVFVEVRSRADLRFGGALSSVSVHKQQRLIRTALHYLAHAAHNPDSPCRFDVVALTQSTDEIVWLRGAFEAN